MTRDPLMTTGITMLTWGGVTGSITTLVVMVVAFLVTGAGGLGGALIGCLAALLVMCAGQLIMIASADMPPTRILVLALATYLMSIGVFIALVLALRGSSLSLMWVSIGAAVGAYGYLAGAIIAYQKARIPTLEQVHKTPQPRDTLSTNE